MQDKGFELNPVRELRFLTVNADGGISARGGFASGEKPPSAFSNGVNQPQPFENGKPQEDGVQFTTDIVRDDLPLRMEKKDNINNSYEHDHDDIVQSQSVSVLDKDRIKAIIESLLFINERPIELKEFMRVLDIDSKSIEVLLDSLTNEYAQRHSGICVVKIAGGYQMCSTPVNESWIRKMYRQRNKQKLSIPSLETLAITAYKQPISRMEIEAIRGVNIDGVMKHLLDLGLIKIGGRKEVIGRPFLYITTRKFLEYFGLNSLKDLPKIEEFAVLADKDKIVQELVREAEEDRAEGGLTFVNG